MERNKINFREQTPNVVIWHIADTKMIEVESIDELTFRKVKDIISRIGKKVPGSKTIIQQCHIFQKRGRYFISHYKHLLEIEGKHSTYGVRDKAFQSTIAQTLEGYGLVKIKLGQDEKFEPLIDEFLLCNLTKKQLQEGWSVKSYYHFHKIK